MPCILKIRMIAARGLPIMDRGSGSTDAYVEVIFGDQDVVRTQICRGTLNPVWNEDFRFEVVDDGRLQVEPLELRVMDYDQITYNDSIGTVWVDLNPLLTWDSEQQISGWMPIYDTLRGVRGELNIQVKLQFFGDVNPFKNSSAGVQFFTIGTLPPNVKLTRIMGHISALETEDDPEHHWSDNFRAPRTSNEARIRLMYRLSGQLRRQLGMKALELNGNAIIGYQQHFDIETENRILVARASGNVVRLIYEHAVVSKRKTTKHLVSTFGKSSQEVSALHHSQQPTCSSTSAQIDNKGSEIREGTSVRKRSLNDSMKHDDYTKPNIPVQPAELESTLGHDFGEGGATEKELITDDIDELDGIDDELLQRNTTTAKHAAMSSGSVGNVNIFTVDSFPPDIITSVGGLVSALSIKVLDDDGKDSRVAYWNELKEELKSHAKALRCSYILGYCEFMSIYDDVAVFQCQGTAANIDVARWLEFENVIAPVFGHFEESVSESQSILQAELISDDNRMMDVSSEVEKTGAVHDRQKSGHGRDAVSGMELRMRQRSQKKLPSDTCKLCHIPYSRSSAPFPTAYYNCNACAKPKKYVPEVLLMTIDPPKELETVGNALLIEAHVFRPKRLDGQGSALSVGDLIPFMQYDAHRQLLYKLRLYGFNAIFSLVIKISIGESGALITATGTGAYIMALPLPPPMKVHRSLNFSEEADLKLADVQRKLMEISEENRKLIEQSLSISNVDKENVKQDAVAKKDDGTDSSVSSDSDSESDASLRQRKGYVVHIDDEQDEDLVLLIMPSLPNGVHIYNSGNGTKSDVFFTLEQKYTQSNFITLVKQKKVNPSDQHLNQFLADLFKSIYDEIQLSVSYLNPCVIARVSHQVTLMDNDMIQVNLCAVVMGNQREDSITRKDFMLGQDTLNDIKLLAKGTDLVGQSNQQQTSTQQVSTPSTLKRLDQLGRSLMKDSSEGQNSVHGQQRKISGPEGKRDDQIESGTTSASQAADGLPTISQKTALGTYSGFSSGGILETAVNFQRYFRSHLRQTNSKTNRSNRFKSYFHNPFSSVEKNDTAGDSRRTKGNLDYTDGALIRKNFATQFNIPSLEGAKEVFITPLSYVPNFTISGFLGRISLHFVREANMQDYDVSTSGTGAFAQSFWREIYSLIKAQARALGGDCVVRFVVDQSSINEDGKHSAYGFISISGDVCSLKKSSSGTATSSSPVLSRETSYAKRAFGSPGSPTSLLVGKPEFSRSIVERYPTQGRLQVHNAMSPGQKLSCVRKLNISTCSPRRKVRCVK